MCRRSFGDLERCPSDDAELKLLPTVYPEVGEAIDTDVLLDEHIADGGMARIFKARDGNTGATYACKVLHPSLALQPYTVERFYRQARVSLRFEHPGIPTVEQYGPGLQGHHFILMELLGGKSLAKILGEEGLLDWERAARIMMNLCTMLGYVHGQSVVHRDIKPENIQVGADPSGGERVWLLDFGIAQVLDEGEVSSATGDVLGTPAYMSPEQIRGERLDGRSDLYSLGVILFEMLCGERPFVGDDPVTVCRMQIYDKPPPLTKRLPRKAYVPPAMKSLVDELLVKSRSSRTPSIGALLGRLHGLLPGHGVSLAMPSVTRPDSRPPSMEQHRLPTGERVTGDLARKVLLLHVKLTL